MNDVAYWSPPEENPNFVSRPPDPGVLDYYGTVAWDAIYHSPFSGAYRFSELSLAKTGALNGVTWNFEDGVTFDQNDADRMSSPLLSAKDATEKYGLGGQLRFDEPVREDAAQIMYRRKIAENDRNYVLQAGANSGFRQVAGLGVGMAATLVDPINVAMMFVPVVGEARMAGMVAKYGITRARLAAGAIEGTVGAALAEPFVLLPAMQEQANYGLEDSALNLGFGAVLGAGLHAGLGAVADKIKALKPKEANAIFESAMNDVLQDRPVSAPAKIYEFTDQFEMDRMADEGGMMYPAPKVEEKPQLTPIEALKAAGETQRDTPETVMLASQRRIQSVGGPALLADALEHIGDLSHRASNINSIGNVREKVRRFLRYLNAGDFNALENSYQAGAEYGVLNERGINDKFWEMAAAGDQTRFDMKDAAIAELQPEIKARIEKAKSETQEALKSYFEAHRDHNKPITDLGRMGREAAMQLAQQDFDGLKITLEKIKNWLDDYDALNTDAEREAKILEGFQGSEPVSPKPQSQLSLNDIPLRDEKGRFIKKERRLQMLQERLNDERARGEIQRDNSVNDNTQPIQPRDNPDIPPRQVDDSEVSVIDQQIADLEAEMTRDPEIGDSVKSRVEELTKDIGDTNARAKGVEAATDCIIRNLI